MKNMFFATMIAVGLLTSALVLADDCTTNDSGKGMQKPQNLSSQVIDGAKDTGANTVTVTERKPAEEQPKEVFHFPGHAFSGR